jgi:hypothetical protein
MNTVSRVLSGTGALGLGAVVIWATVSEGADFWSLVWGVLWGVLIGGVGVYIFFNKQEDEIEQIKDYED